MLGIVIPAYKRPECLEGALESLVNQTFKRFITIVVDDHSPEPLEPVVNKFKDKLHIIYKYAEENGGPGVARQIGLEICYKLNLDLVMFVDSDDKLYPQAAARLTQEINRTFCDMISANFYNEGPQGAGSVNSPTNKTWLHGKIFRTSFLKNNNVAFTKLRTNEDVAFCLMVTESKAKCAYLQEELSWIGYERRSITRTKELPLERISADYIRAIYETTQFLLKQGGLTKQMLVNIAGCYNHYQVSKICNLLDEDCIQKMKWLVNTVEFQNFVNSKDIGPCQPLISHWFQNQEGIHYFTQSFGQWLEEMSQ